MTFAHWLAREIGVATVPGSSFFSNKADGARYVRFAFCKKFDTLQRAARCLRTIPDELGHGAVLA